MHVRLGIVLRHTPVTVGLAGTPKEPIYSKSLGGCQPVITQRPRVTTMSFVVQVQGVKGCSAHRSFSCDDSALFFPLEVLCPAVLSWVKEPNGFPGFGVQRINPFGFVAVAGRACQPEIALLGCATPSLRYDVIDFQQRTDHLLRGEAVAAPVVCRPGRLARAPIPRCVAVSSKRGKMRGVGDVVAALLEENRGL